jgi:hypothetical protein
MMPVSCLPAAVPFTVRVRVYYLGNFPDSNMCQCLHACFSLAFWSGVICLECAGAVLDLFCIVLPAFCPSNKFRYRYAGAPLS